MAKDISDRLQSMFLLDANGRRPVFGGTEKFQQDPLWRDHLPFYEYFHGDNGAGLGASHQTGWTALVAELAQMFGSVDASSLDRQESGVRAARGPGVTNGMSMEQNVKTDQGFVALVIYPSAPAGQPGQADALLQFADTTIRTMPGFVSGRVFLGEDGEASSVWSSGATANHLRASVKVTSAAPPCRSSAICIPGRTGCVPTRPSTPVNSRRRCCRCR